MSRAGRRTARRLALLCGLLALGACGTPAPPPAPALPPLAAEAPAGEFTRYAVLPQASELRLLVYREGPLERLGHNHVVHTRDIGGEILLAADFHRSSFSLRIPVAGFEVDAPAARAEEGAAFAQPPDAEAVAGTLRNLLGAGVLDAAHHPHIAVRSVGLAGPAWAPDVTLRVTLRGVERQLTIPAALERRDDRLGATAVFEIRQSDFGIAPLSVLGGSLRVADTVRVRLRIVAQRL